MMAGLAFQVFTLLVFLALCLDYVIRLRQNPATRKPETRELRAGSRFRLFVAALVVAFVAILVRCVYRIVEMAGGWRNAVMQDEASFIALDST